MRGFDAPHATFHGVLGSLGCAERIDFPIARRTPVTSLALRSRHEIGKDH